MEGKVKVATVGLGQVTEVKPVADLSIAPALLRPGLARLLAE